MKEIIVEKKRVLGSEVEFAFLSIPPAFQVGVLIVEVHGLEHPPGLLVPHRVRKVPDWQVAQS